MPHRIRCLVFVSTNDLGNEPDLLLSDTQHVNEKFERSISFQIIILEKQGIPKQKTQYVSSNIDSLQTKTRSCAINLIVMADENEV